MPGGMLLKLMEASLFLMPAVTHCSGFPLSPLNEFSLLKMQARHKPLLFSKLVTCATTLLCAAACAITKRRDSKRNIFFMGSYVKRQFLYGSGQVNPSCKVEGKGNALALQKLSRNDGSYKVRG